MRSSSQCLSQRLADEFRAKIQSGQWEVGKKLPTTRELASQYKVSLNTVQSAFRELVAINLVTRDPRRGGVVKSREVSPGRIRTAKATEIGVFAPINLQIDAAQDRDDWRYRIIRAFEGEIHRAGYHLSTFSYDPNDPDVAVKLLERVDRMGGDLAGMMGFLTPSIVRFCEELDKRNLPWVTINRAHGQVMHNFVMADNFNGGRMVGRIFGMMGLRRVAFVGHDFRAGRSDGDKFSGFVQGYIEAGGRNRDVDFVGRHNGDEHLTMEQVLGTYLDESGVPRGFLAGGDQLALELLRLCRQRNIDVPRQMGIVAATGLRMAEYSHPAMTVLAQPMERMGQEAARMVLEMVRDETRRLLGRIIPSPFIVRETLQVPEEILRAVQKVES